MTSLRWNRDIKKANPPAKAYLPLLRTAFAADPDRKDLLRDFVVSLRDGNHWQEIIKILLPLHRKGELHPRLIFELGLAAEACEDFALALAAFEQTAADGIPRSNQKMSGILDSLGRHEDAEKLARKALQENPRDEEALEVVAHALLRRDDAPGLDTLCDDLAGQGVASTTLLAYHATRMALSGRTQDLDAFLEPKRWCYQTIFGPDQIDNNRLADAILQHPDLAPSSVYKATRGSNMRLKNLANQRDPTIQHFVSLVRDQINAYVAARMDARLHPFMAQQPTEARLQGWSLVMSKDGHELPHIHSKSWLTSVYYVRTPEILEGECPHPGAIVFGAWPPGLEDKLHAFPTWHLTPQAGMLLIFPAFMAHRTIPTQQEDLRISIVLDVLCD
ncbi:MAG: putative 2OG-Fe(II) oxygenase [Pseudomonadota bacterium]